MPRHDMPRGGRSGFVLVDQRQVHYLEWGASPAPPVVCLHGGGQTAYMWEELGVELGHRYHVLAPDLPWHGDSDPSLDMTRQGLAATIPPLLAEFGLSRVALVGASLGGIVSLTLAAAHAELVSAVALIDIGHRLEDEGVNRIIDFMAKQESFASLDEAAREVAAYLPQRKAVRAENLRRNLRQRPDGRWEWKHGYGRQLRQGEEGFRGWRELTAGLDDEITTLHQPVLVLRGVASDVLSSEGAEEVAALIPNSRLATIGSAGHHAAGDNPESVAGLVNGFFADVGW
ncbi:MAG TPA: alpha/beta hydrolase [Acidimicrobiia bacterium]|nr:alpha/beta hydrolase [Acidimicrobiia bacterium]